MGLLHISKIESRGCSHREYLSRYCNLRCSRHDACLTIGVGRQGEVAQGVADANGAIRQVAQVSELALLALHLPRISVPHHDTYEQTVLISEFHATICA